jgi:hypothetical protein
MALIRLVDEVTSALMLAETIARQEGDISRAVRLLERFVAHDLPQDLARQLLEARITLLQTQARDAGSSAAGALNHQLAIAYQQLAALDTALAPSIDTPHVATHKPPSDQAPPQALSSSHNTSPEAALSALVGRAIKSVMTASAERPSDQAATESDQGRVPGDRPPAVAAVTDEVGPLEVAPGTAIVPAADSSTNNLLPLPFRTDSASEVGDWKQILQAAIARPFPEESHDSNPT